MPSLVRPRPVDLVPVATAATLATIALVLEWRGGDWPAQLLRIEVVERGGLVWNNMWFAGHATPGYGVVLPLLAAAIGTAPVAIASCVVAAACFHALACGTATRRRVLAASALFAAGTVVNVAVGRLTFALGLTAGLAALVALRRGHLVVGAVLTALTAPASPVAGALLALVLAAWAIDTRRIRLAVLALLAVAPIAVTAAAFPEHGPFPFRAAALLWSVVAAGIVAAWTTARVVRIAAALFAGACVLMFLVPNPVGANATRFGMFFAAPVLVLTGRRVRTPLVAVAVAAMLWWQWSPAVDGIQLAGRDPSASAAFHEPLIAAIRDSPGGGRVEVVPTRHHWEAFHVASELPLARGWERQLDRERNALFYDGELDATSYRQWLQDQAVGFVALADVALDPSGRAEAELVSGGLPYLEPVWSDAQWQLWRVVDAVPLVDGPATVVTLDPTAVTLDVTGTEPVLLRVNYTSHWTLDQPGQVAAGADGWTVVRADAPGRITLRATPVSGLPIIGLIGPAP